MQEQFDLDLLAYGESEGVEVHLQQQEDETHNPEEEPENKANQVVELSSDEEEE